MSELFWVTLNCFPGSWGTSPSSHQVCNPYIFSPLLKSIPLDQQHRGCCCCGIGTRTRLEPLESNSCGNSMVLHIWKSCRNEKHTQRAVSWPVTKCCAHHQCCRDRQRMREKVPRNGRQKEYPDPLLMSETCFYMISPTGVWSTQDSSRNWLGIITWARTYL